MCDGGLPAMGRYGNVLGGTTEVTGFPRSAFKNSTRSSISSSLSVIGVAKIGSWLGSRVTAALLRWRSTVRSAWTSSVSS